MDTWAIMSQIKYGYGTLLDVYLQQEEARERREMFSRKLKRARVRYELMHSNESDTDDDSYEDDCESKHFCHAIYINNLSEKQDQPEEESTDGLNMRPNEVIHIDSDDDTDDSDEQAKVTKSLIIKKIWSQRGSSSTIESDLDSPEKNAYSNGVAYVTSANKYVISPDNDDGIEILEENSEIEDLCTPPRANHSSVAVYQNTPTTSNKRFRKRRLNFTI